MCLHLMLVNVYSQWHRFGSKSGGGGARNGRAGASWKSATKFTHTHTHTGKCAQQTIAILGDATILRVGYKTMLRAERAQNFWVSTPNCDIFRYISRKWSPKNCGIYLYWRQKGSLCPLLPRCLAKSGGTNYITPPPEILGDSSPFPLWSTPLCTVVDISSGKGGPQPPLKQFQISVQII